MIFHTLRTIAFVLHGAFVAPPLPHVFAPAATQMYVGLRTMDVFLHVNHAKYLEFFELARWHQGARAGMMERLKSTGIYPVIGVAHVQYVSQMRCFKIATVHTRIVGIHRRAFLIEQHITTRDAVTKKDTLHATLLAKATFLKGGKPADVADVLKAYDMDPVEFRRTYPWSSDDAAPSVTFPREVTLLNEADDAWRKALRDGPAVPPWAEQ